MAKIILATQKSLQTLQQLATELTKKKAKDMKSLSKSKFGTAWAVIRDPNNGKYLICRRGPTANNAGQWGFAGGGVDEGESHQQGCRRETKEEILVDLPLKMFHAVMSEDETDTVWFEVFQKVSPKKTEEVDAYAWVYPYQMDEYHIHKSVRNYFKRLHGQVKKSAV